MEEITSGMATELLESMEGLCASQVLDMFREYMGERELWNESYYQIIGVMSNYVRIDCYLCRWRGVDPVNDLLALLLYSRGVVGEKFEISFVDDHRTFLSFFFRWTYRKRPSEHFYFPTKILR